MASSEDNIIPQVSVPEKRKTISKQHQIIVWRRDAWTCRYCDSAVFFSPVLRVFNELNPGHGYYHKNGKTNEILDIFQWRWASVDHFMPVTRGGKNTLENYVTACWRCNLSLNNKYDDKVQPNPVNEINKKMQWDGLSGLYLHYGPRDAWHKLLSVTELKDSS